MATQKRGPKVRDAPCAVCDSTRGTSLFYGGLVCCGCKVFFLRSVMAKADYKCSSGGNCKLTHGSPPSGWIKCRSCRYQKCLEANMNPQAVGVVRCARKPRETVKVVETIVPKVESPFIESLGSPPEDNMLPDVELDEVDTASCSFAVPDSYSTATVVKQEPPISSQRSPSPPEYTDMATPPPSTSSIVTMNKNVVPYIDFGIRGYSSILLSPSVYPQSTQEIISRLSLLESCCNVSDHCLWETSSYYNIDVPLGDALRNPLALCQRTPMGFASRLVVTSSILDSFRALYCRYALHYLDWIVGIPEMHLLPDKDKMAMITSQMCQTELAVLFYNSYTTRSPGICFPGGHHFILSDRPCTNEIDEFCAVIARYVHNEVFPELNALQLSHEEFVLLKTIAFFSPTVVLTEEGANIVRNSRARYEQALVELIAERFPHWGETERHLRVYKVISLKRHLVMLALKDNIFLSRLFTLNIGNMQGSLLYDLYLKNY